jgi:hypothetical protein
VSGKITATGQPELVETADDLAQPLENTTPFLSGLFDYENAQGRSCPWGVITFGTDTSLFTAPAGTMLPALGCPTVWSLYTMWLRQHTKLEIVSNWQSDSGPLLLTAYSHYWWEPLPG